MTEVVTSHEAARGCGFRKPDKTGVGIYLVGPGTGVPCGRLPLPVGHCPVCSQGIKPSRAWTWIEPKKLFAKAPPCPDRPKTGLAAAALDVRQSPCATCWAGGAMPDGRHGMLWIGEGFYPTPHHFLAEAAKQGVSRKLPAIPKGFQLGETVVYFAHRFACPGDAESPQGLPGIFATFRPSGIDLVIEDASNIPERALKLAEEVGAGARIVKVVQKEEQQPLPFSGGDS